MVSVSKPTNHATFARYKPFSSCPSPSCFSMVASSSSDLDPESSVGAQRSKVKVKQNSAGKRKQKVNVRKANLSCYEKTCLGGL